MDSAFAKKEPSMNAEKVKELKSQETSMTTASSEEILRAVARAAAEAIREADITDGDLECAENALRNMGLGELLEAGQVMRDCGSWWSERNGEKWDAALAKLKGSR